MIMLTNSLELNIAASENLADLSPAIAAHAPVRPRFDLVPSTKPSRIAVEIAPGSVVRRKTAAWDGMAAEIIEYASHQRAEIRFTGPVHLLALCERGQRREGKSTVEGLLSSEVREMTGTLSFVPAGHNYRETFMSNHSARIVYFYLDVAKLQAFDLNTPRLLFEDPTLLDTALKLTKVVEGLSKQDHPYLDALGRVLVQELRRLHCGCGQIRPQARGGLAAWQQRVVAAYVDEHLADEIPLATLAQMARLSSFHFCRAFKQSFGVPPHRYHIARRIEHAKALLVNSGMSVTEIGLETGFKETSSFSATFRKLTGITPTGYSRLLSDRRAA
jgi:AraC family transcriptional regulator